MPIGDIFKLEMKFLLHAQRCQYTLHFKGISAGSNPQGLVNDIDATIGFQMGQGQSNQLAFYEYYASQIFPTSPETGSKLFSVERTGLVAEAAISSDAATFVQLRTAVRGRNTTGHLYVGGTPISYYENSIITAAGNAGITGFLNNLRLIYGEGGFDGNYRWSVYSRQAGSIETINEVRISTILSRMRKRKIGVGL